MRLASASLLLLFRAARGWRYECELCACGFDKRKNYAAHLAGVRHAASLAAEPSVWRDWEASGGAWYSPAVSRCEATRAWSLDRFVDGLPGRTRSSIGRTLGAAGGGGDSGDEETGQLDPGLTLDELPAGKRAALFRYCRDLGDRVGRCPAPPRLAFPAMLAQLDPRYCRVKEILESCEAYSHAARLLSRRRVSAVVDIGCGHGLIAMLCAAALPEVQVLAIDLAPRDSFTAQREAFERSGTRLDNLRFSRGGLGEARDGTAGKRDVLLLCVHGCNQLTPDAIQLARARGWAWLAVPCCLQSAPHLGLATLRLPDRSRHALLCGALAAHSAAESVTAIDSRITARGIVLASVGGEEAAGHALATRISAREMELAGGRQTAGAKAGGGTGREGDSGGVLGEEGTGQGGREVRRRGGGAAAPPLRPREAGAAGEGG